MFSLTLISRGGGSVPPFYCSNSKFRIICKKSVASTTPIPNFVTLPTPSVVYSFAVTVQQCIANLAMKTADTWQESRRAGRASERRHALAAAAAAAAAGGKWLRRLNDARRTRACSSAGSADVRGYRPREPERPGGESSHNEGDPSSNLQTPSSLEKSRKEKDFMAVPTPVTRL